MLSGWLIAAIGVKTTCEIGDCTIHSSVEISTQVSERSGHRSERFVAGCLLAANRRLLAGKENQADR